MFISLQTRSRGGAPMRCEHLVAVALTTYDQCDLNRGQEEWLSLQAPFEISFYLCCFYNLQFYGFKERSCFVLLLCVCFIVQLRLVHKEFVLEKDIFEYVL